MRKVEVSETNGVSPGPVPKPFEEPKVGKTRAKTKRGSKRKRAQVVKGSSYSTNVVRETGAPASYRQEPEAKGDPMLAFDAAVEKLADRMVALALERAFARLSLG